MDAPRYAMGAGRFALAAALLVAVAAPVHAQTTPTATPARPAASQPSSQELNPASRVSAPPEQERDLFTPEPAGPCPLVGSDVQVTLKGVGFRGTSEANVGRLSAAYAGQLGKPLPVAAICQIRDRAARILFDLGVLARVEIPEQRISDGNLVLDVIEARVVNVRVRGDAGPAQAAVERYVEQLRGMKPFDMRKAQRYLLLASDIPGVRIRAAIRPSVTGERGAVDIDVTVVRTAVNAIANVQNLGSKTIGRVGALARVDVNGLTGLGEQTSLVAFHTLGSNEQWVVQGLEEVRIGGDGLVGRGSLVYGETRPGDFLKPLGLKSKSFVGEVEAAYPVLRLRRLNLNLAGGFDWVDQDTDVLNVGLLNRDRLRVFYLRSDGDFTTRALDRLMQFNGSVSVRKGVGGLGASDAGSILLSRAGGTPDAWVLRASGGFRTTLVERLSFSVQARGQYSARPLLPYEQLALGDLTIGRGYDPAVVSGDSGVSGAFELRYGALALRPRLLALPYVFYDIGWVRNNDVTAASGLLASRTLRSVGGGVVFRLNERFNLDVSYASPLSATVPDGVKPESRVLFNLTGSLQ